MRRKIVQIMIVVIMLFGATAWTVGGRAPARPTNEPAQKEVVPTVVLRGRKHGHPIDPRPVVYPYPVATEEYSYP